MQRHCVALTLVQRCISIMYPLSSFLKECSLRAIEKLAKLKTSEVSRLASPASFGQWEKAVS